MHAQIEDMAESDSKDRHGRSPPSYGVEEGHEAVMRFLVARDDEGGFQRQGRSFAAVLRCATWARHGGQDPLGRDDVEVNTKDFFFIFIFLYHFIDCWA